MFLGERSVFSYCICKRELLECEAVKVRVGEYHVYTNRNTHFDYREDPDVSSFRHRNSGVFKWRGVCFGLVVET